MKKLEGYERGVNLGGWLSQGELNPSHLATFITEEDIKKISSWGLDHIRLPLDFENLEDEDGNTNELGFTYVDACISWCRKYKLNVVLDLHKTMGYTFDDFEYSKGFFENKKLQDRFIGLWDKISKRYSKYSDSVMFEMLNEVTRFDVVDEWNRLATRCIETIRRNAPEVKILFGGVGYSAVTAVKFLPKPYDENIVYNIHCYEPLLFTHQGAYWVEDMPQGFRIEYPGDFDFYMKKTRTIKGCLGGALADEKLPLKALGADFFEVLFKEAIETCEKYDVALYCGEYGVIDLASPESTLNWYKDINAIFRKYNIGRAAWNYKEKDFGIEGRHYDSIRDELLKYM